MALNSASVQAETIDAGGNLFDNLAGAPGTATKVCVKIAFIKRNVGAMVTGLTTAKIKLFSVTEKSLNPTTFVETSKNFNVTYSLAASATPVEPGVYDFCVTPSGVGNVWKKPGNTGYSYAIAGVVHGTVVGDNGVFSVFLR